MKAKNLLMLITLAGLMIFASCKKDETPDPLSYDEATAALTNISTNYSTDLNAFEASDANQAMNAVYDLALPFSTGGMKAPLNQKIVKSEVLKVYNPSKGAKGGLWDINLTEYAGTWRLVDGTWTKTLPTPTDKIVVIFSYNGGTDNATITYYNYEKKNLSYAGESMTYMSSLSFKLDIVGKTNPVVAWDYTSAMTMSASSYGMKMKFVYKLGEYSLTQAIAISQSSGNTSSENIFYVLEEIKKGSDVLRGASFEITTTSGQSGENLSITAKYRVKDIIIKWVITIGPDTNTSGNPDDYMDISVWTAGGAKVADVVFKLESDIYVPYFRFTDGTEVPITDYLSEDLNTDIGYFMDDFMDFKK